MYLTMNERHSVIERLLSLFMGQYDSFSKTQKINDRVGGYPLVGQPTSQSSK